MAAGRVLCQRPQRVAPACHPQRLHGRLRTARLRRQPPRAVPPRSVICRCRDRQERRCAPPAHTSFGWNRLPLRLPSRMRRPRAKPADISLAALDSHRKSAVADLRTIGGGHRHASGSPPDILEPAQPSLARLDRQAAASCNPPRVTARANGVDSHLLESGRTPSSAIRRGADLGSQRHSGAQRLAAYGPSAGLTVTMPPHEGLGRDRRCPGTRPISASASPLRRPSAAIGHIQSRAATG